MLLCIFHFLLPASHTIIHHDYNLWGAYLEVLELDPSSPHSSSSSSSLLTPSTMDSSPPRSRKELMSKLAPRKLITAAHFQASTMDLLRSFPIPRLTTLLNRFCFCQRCLFKLFLHICNNLICLPKCLAPCNTSNILMFIPFITSIASTYFVLSNSPSILPGTCKNTWS
jgi:hypothetical protein